jgi:drug/metabolite transporter (DMT)-like permease
LQERAFDFHPYRGKIPEKDMMSILLVILLYATWSSVFAIGKWTLDVAPPLFITSVRMLLAGAILTVFLAFQKKLTLKLSYIKWLSIALLAFLSIYLSNAFEFWGLRHLSAGKTCFIYSLSPFFSALFSYLHFKEKMSPRKWIGMLIGIVGMTPVLMRQTGNEGLFGGVGFISWPSLAVIGAALTAVYGWVLLRLIVKDDGLSPVLANGYSMLLGGAFALIHSYIFESWIPAPVSSVPLFLQGTLAMTFISNIVCYNLYGFLLRRFTATFLSFMGLLSPIFASINSWILLGETPSWEIFLSTTIVLSGSWLVYREELRQGYIQKKKEAALAE